MTLEQLCNSSADELEKLSQKELEEFFAPYLNVTRPERVRQQRKDNGIAEDKLHTVFLAPGKVAALEKLKQITDIDLSFLQKRKRKF